jgi:hypothetical protein
LDSRSRRFTENVRLIGPDQTTVLRQSQVKFGLQDAHQHATNVTVFSQLEFPAPGVYYVEVLVDEVMKLRFPLPLAVVPAASAESAAADQSRTGRVNRNGSHSAIPSVPRSTRRTVGNRFEKRI